MKKVNLRKNVNSELAFVVKVDDRIVCNSYPLLSPSWLHFEQFLRNKLNYEQIEVKYKDEDGDDVCLSSEEEFQEALKVYQKMNTFLTLTVTPVKSDAPNDFNAVDGDGLPKPEEQYFSENISKSRSLPQHLDKGLGFNNSPSKTSEELQVKSSTSTGSSFQEETTPPEWFCTYMEKFKGDVASESARKVIHRIQKLSLHDETTVAPVQTKHSRRKDAFQEHQVQPKSFTSATIKPTENAVIHTGITCDNCKETVTGIRYKCGNCVKFDLCEKCEALQDIHVNHHVFVKIRHPAPTAGINKKTGKMTPLLKYLLYNEFDKNIDIRTDREKKLLKRLEKQAYKLDKYREKYRQRHSDRNIHSNLWNVSSCNQHHSDHSIYYQQQQQQCQLIRKQLTDLEDLEERADINGKELNTFSTEMMDAKFVNDETFPDGSEVLPSNFFTKRWKLLNSGTHSWSDATVLKCLWGTVGLKPLNYEIAVPPLKPGEEGIISVKFKAPEYEGHFESHWRLYHKGQRFGHRIWCSITVRSPLKTANLPPTSTDVEVPEVDGTQVQEPENGEKEPISENKCNTNFPSKDENRTSNLIITKPSEKNEKEDNIQEQYDLITATPNNTPRDLSPPKSPEPEQENLMTELTMAFEEKEHDNFLSEGDSDFGGSLVSLSSNDSELSYVVVPLPSCFNLSVPAVSIHGVPPKPDTSSTTPPEAKEENSSVTTASDTEEETASDYRASQKPNECSNFNNASDTEEDCSRTTLQDEVEISSLCTHSQVCFENPSAVEAESGENLASENAVNSNQISGNIEDKMSINVNPMHGTDTQHDKENRQEEKSSTLPSSSVQVSSDRMVPILPEPIMTVAASVFNSTRAIITTITEASNMRSVPTSTAEAAPVPPQPPQSNSTHISPIDQLHDMGFYNRDLNQQMLMKHNGDINLAVAELLLINDNDWYSNRH